MQEQKKRFERFTTKLNSMSSREKRQNSFYGRLLDLENNMNNFALSLTSNKEDAEDLTQETFLKVLDNKEKYIENTNFKGWVFTIMRNIFINNYRRIVRSQTMVDTTDDLYHLSLPQDSGLDSPDVAYGVGEITDVINSFPEEFRKPFSLYVAGYKYNEIAEEMNIPLGTVKSRIFFARKKLQEILADYRS